MKTIAFPIALFAAWPTLSAPAMASEGQLDTTFGGTGIVTTTITVNAVAVGSAGSVFSANNGKIMIGGAAGDGLAAASIMPDGSVDAAYGNLSGQGGRSQFDLSGDGLSFFYYEGAALIPGSGKNALYLAGTSFISSRYTAVVLRVTAAGALDTNFAGNGYALVNVPNSTTPDALFARAVTTLPDGTAIVGGEDSSVTGTPNYLAKFLANGTQDGTFGGGAGFLHIAKPPSTQGNSIVDMKTDNAGNILVATQYGLALGGSRFSLFRVSGSGILDTAFAGGATFAVVDFGVEQSNGYDYPSRVVPLSDGKILLMGAIGASTPPTGRCGFARFNSDGTPDMTFANAGLQTLTYNSASISCTAVAVQGKRRLIVAASSGTTKLVVGLNYSDGSIDTSFGTDGFTTVPYAVADVTIDKSERPILTGSPGAPGFYAARLTSDAVFVDSFDDN
jgi:uncharacterized delta-60 repeat protein